MARIFFAFVFVLAASAADGAGTLIVLASRGGVIEFVDPAMLATVGRIQVGLPAGSVGLNGVAVSADQRRLYVEGPLGADPSGCCWRYAIDLSTMQSSVESGISGSASRKKLAISDGVAREGAAAALNNDLLHTSPDGRWIMGTRSFRGPVLDVVDAISGSLVRQLKPEGLEGNWSVDGTWLGNSFYLYALNSTSGEGRLWRVSSGTTELGAGVTFGSFGNVAGCSDPYLRSMVAAGGKLFIYDAFGFKVSHCFDQNPAGAWMVDSASGQLIRHIVPGVHFSSLLADRDGAKLYGLILGGSAWYAVELVQIDARDGTVMNRRALDSGFWRMIIAPARAASGFVNLIPFDEQQTGLLPNRR